MRHTAALAAALAFSGAAAAEELRTDWLPAELIWVAHLDAERFFASAIGQMLTAEGPLDFGDFDIEELERHLNMDAETELLGLTIFGPADGGEVVIISLAESVDMQPILDYAAEEGDDHRTATVGGHTLHIWDDGTVTYLQTDGPTRYVVVGEKPKLVAGAVAVIHGDAPSHKDVEKPSMVLDPPDGAIAYGAIRSGKMLPDMDVVSKVLQNAGEFSLALSERDDMVVATMSMTADSRQTARDLVEVLEGIMALVRLNAGENEWFAQMADLVGNTEVSRTGRRISIALAVSSDRMIELLGMMEQM